MHAPIAMAFLKAGIHVICDKPLTLDRRGGARTLVKLAKKTGMIFALTHNYTGYPMIRQAREMVAAGELGDIRVVQAEYRAGLADRAAREDRPEAGGLAHRSEAVRRRRLRSATSAPMPTISPASSPA